jgi:hypothetical protein
MANTTTLNETLRSPIDGTENIRLATAGANWKAQLGNQTWIFGGVAGGNGSGSVLTLQSTTGVGATDYIAFQTSSQSERGRIDTVGNVNFGNNGGTLNDNANQTPRFQISGTQDTLDLRRYSADTSGPTITSAKSRNAAVGTNTAVNSGDSLLQVIAGGYDATATPALQQSSYIAFTADAAPTAGSVAGRIGLFTAASGSGTPTEAGRVDSNQNIMMVPAAIATNATGGFFYLQSCAGVPSGSPTAAPGGAKAMVIDSSNHNLYFNDGSWQLVPSVQTGTWTPTLAGSATFTARVGEYTKIGRMVFLVCQININVIGTTAATAQITGAPFSSPSVQSGAVGFFAGSATNVASIGCYINGTSININGVTAIGAATTDPVGFWGSGANIYFTICYHT